MAFIIARTAKKMKILSEAMHVYNEKFNTDQFYHPECHKSIW